MAADGNDRTMATGLVLAVLSATTFALSGPLARCLLDVGWSAGAVVLTRIAIAALVVAPFAEFAFMRRALAASGEIRTDEAPGTA